MNAPSAFVIQQTISLAQQAIAKMEQEDGQIFAGDDTGLIEALSAENIDLNTVLSRIGRAIVDRGTMLDAADARLADLKQRKERFGRQMDAYRDLLLQAMSVVGLRSFRDPEFTASLRDGKPRLYIIDATALPPAMVAVQTALVPNKAAIRAALDRGETIPGAELGNAAPPILSICAR